MDKEKEFRGVKWRAFYAGGDLTRYFEFFFVSSACFVVVRTKRRKISLLLFFSSLDTPSHTNKKETKKKNWAFVGVSSRIKKNIIERDACAYPILCSRLSASRREKREREKERVKIIESVRIGVHESRRERERESRKQREKRNASSRGKKRKK